MKDTKQRKQDVEKIYDVFISYRRDGGADLARLVYEKLRGKGLSVFFDMEELRAGVFDEKLYDAIEASRNVAVILPAGALDRCSDDGDWLRLEIEYALESGKNLVPVMMPAFQWPDSGPSTMASFSKFNGVVWSHVYFDASLKKLIELLVDVNIVPKDIPSKSAARNEAPRVSNQYFAASAEFEKRRLATQQRLIEAFDKSTYDSVVQGANSLRVLDLGSNAGDLAMGRFGGTEKLLKYLGIDCDGGAVSSGNERFGKAGQILFLQSDLESDACEESIRLGSEELGISDYNVAHLSMILLHLKNPYPVLKTVRRHLSPDGVVIVRDIDDGLNLAYPDDDGSFARVVGICGRNETSGYRKSGRQVYTLLRHAGFRNVQLERVILSTCGMDFDAREAFFNVYFSFVLDDLRIMKERHPTDDRINADYEWFSSQYDTLAEKFQDESFFFSLGFMLFTARRA